VIFQVAHRETLRHNPLNAVTAIVERVTDPSGTTMVRKELRRPGPEDEPMAGSWAASTRPEHWNYWRREADAYLLPELRESLMAAGLDMPAAQVEEQDGGITLWLEDVIGTPGTDFSLDDHVVLAENLGRWQAQGPLQVPWASQRFLREYSGSRHSPLHLIDDEAVWRHPLIRETWPDGLRTGWQRLLAHRPLLLDIMERLPRTRSHLDLWVSNEIRRTSGGVVLLDWAFTGDGALGEDLGNHVPDAVFDLFWPAERLGKLDLACYEAYLVRLRQAGWRGTDRGIRLGMVASCVRYAGLLPLMLERTSAAEHPAYHQAADPYELYSQRGLAFKHLVGWCDEAVGLAGV